MKIQLKKSGGKSPALPPFNFVAPYEIYEIMEGDEDDLTREVFKKYKPDGELKVGDMFVVRHPMEFKVI